MLTHFLPFIIGVVMTSVMGGTFMHVRSTSQSAAIPFGCFILCFLCSLFNLLICFFPLR